MKKIKSYDKTMAHFLVTPGEMRLLASSVLLEQEYERILKHARFSEMIYGHYCVRADLRFLEEFLDYVLGTLYDFKSKSKREQVKDLALRIHNAYFNPEVQKREEAARVISSAQDAIAEDEISRDPAFQEHIANLKPLIETIDACGGEPRIEYLKCPYCGAKETTDSENNRVLLDLEKLPTGYEEMVILEEHEERYNGDGFFGYIITYKFMCPACKTVQVSVWPSMEFP